jgi:O-methyltransferase
MARPEDIDKRWDGVPALPTWENAKATGSTWGYGGTVDMVRTVMRTSGYPEDKLVFVEGMVEDTIPGTMAERLCLLRLDTDLYKSTYHELKHLYPTLSSGGILILDDYGHFQGARAGGPVCRREQAEDFSEPDRLQYPSGGEALSRPSPKTGTNRFRS